MSFVGIKVVRGPNWSWGKQDGGEGNQGIVSLAPNIALKTAKVRWNNNFSSNYRVGYSNKYDLRIIDNASTGVIHKKMSCTSCKVENIPGLRYQCTSCKSCNLCVTCYHYGKHSLDHSFTLFVTELCPGINLPKRINAKQVEREKGFSYYSEHLPVLGQNPSKESRNQSEGQAECAVCSGVSEHNVRFEPCNHQTTCEECSPCVKNCLVCEAPVKRRVTEDGRVVLTENQRRIKRLEAKIQEIEEKHYCVICSEQRCNLLFMCGHKACSKCVAKLSVCHMCRQSIETRVNI